MGVLKTWRGGNVCEYKGFACLVLPDEGEKGVTGVDFNGFGLGGKNGSLPLDGFIDGLEDLVFFHTNSNKVTSLLTDKISKFRYLFELDLSNNQLTGGFPPAVLTATNLTFLDLRFNDLRGPLPPEVFELDLRALFLNNDGFSGNIPVNIGRTPVFYLTLSSNEFVGPIPSSLGTGNTSEKLIEVLLLNNRLSGCLPYQIGLLKRNTVFDASINRLKGPIPQSFSCLSEMRLLNLSYNTLSGVIPESVCQLPNLISLSLQYNYFTQVGPQCRKLIKSKKLDVSMNCIIDLPSQRDQSECKKFYSKRTPCPSENLVSHVPCTLDHLLHDVDTSKSEVAQEIAASPTYAALDPERRYSHN